MHLNIKLINDGNFPNGHRSNCDRERFTRVGGGGHSKNRLPKARLYANSNAGAFFPPPHPRNSPSGLFGGGNLCYVAKMAKKWPKEDVSNLWSSGQVVKYSNDDDAAAAALSSCGHDAPIMRRRGHDYLMNCSSQPVKTCVSCSVCTWKRGKLS